MSEGESSMLNTAHLDQKHACSPALIISLDFELYWGIRDRLKLSVCRERIIGARLVIPKILAKFQEYNVHATWATVGFLFFENKRQLLSGLPAALPTYSDPVLSPYPYIKELGNDERHDPFHFGYSLVHGIQNTPFQEIGSHTFSHYYCLALGQTLDQFSADMEAARNAARQIDVNLESLVFPRNQFSEDACRICRRYGIQVVRGNQTGWAYRGVSKRRHSLATRAFRLADSTFNLSGHHPLTRDQSAPDDMPYNAYASSFLRAYNHRFPMLTSLQIRRLVSSMTYAARTGSDFHLWWHPHNFGADPDRNLAHLDVILRLYEMLQARYGMRSLTMGEWARERAAPISAG